MNFLKKAGCRIFQTVLRLALPILPYSSPKVLNAVTEVPGLLKQREISRVLLVTDAAIYRMGMTLPLEQALAAENIAVTVFDGTVPNPTVQNVEDAKELYLKHGCEVLIGFGGGSAIDCAKAVGARLARPRKPIPKMEGILGVLRMIPYLIAVPTTAGTGSETTLATVICDGAGHKFPISDFCLIPRAAVLDPELTRSLPPSLTATTGMDALTHAVEAYIGRSTTKGTRSDALEAARLISENLERAYIDGNDMVAWAGMLRAAFLAGRAFSKSYVGYCHAVAHSLGGKYGVPHGLANAVLLPHILEAYGPAAYQKLKDIALAMDIAGAAADEETAAKALIAHIRGMNSRMGIPGKLKGVQKADIAGLAALADREANPLYPVPVLMDAAQLEQFYYDVMEEQP